MIQFDTTRFLSFRFRCKRSIIILSLLWLTGLLSGFTFALHSGNAVSNSVYSAAAAVLSIPGIMIVLFLPVISLMICIYYKSYIPLYIYCPIKAFTYSYSLCAAGLCFGNGAWLIRFFLFFSDSIAVVFMLSLCYYFMYAQGDLRKELKLSGAVLIAAGLLDYFCISPFLVMLLNYS